MAGGDWVGDNGKTWYRGSGIGREEVKGPCLLRNDGAFFLLKRNNLGNVLGIPYVKNKAYQWGNVVMAVNAEGVRSSTKLSEFIFSSNSQENNWNTCDPSRPIDERTGLFAPIPDGPGPDENDQSNWSSTPITQNIDWRIALAVLLAVAALLWWLLKKK